MPDIFTKPIQKSPRIQKLIDTLFEKMPEIEGRPGGAAHRIL